MPVKVIKSVYRYYESFGIKNGNFICKNDLSV